MILDSSFGCALDIHTGAYLLLSPRFLVIIGLCGYLIHGYRDVWWILIDSLFYIKYPYWVIFPSPWWDCVWATVHRWMISSGYLPHDFSIKSYTGAYFSIFFEYPWDWDNGQLGFRLSTSIGLPTIDCIGTSLHGFVEIEMNCIRFHSRSIDGFFSQRLMR